VDILPYGRHHIDEDDIQAVVDCLRGGYLTQGPRIIEFEQSVADYVGARYAVAVSSGTAALHLAALAAGAGPDVDIITSPITFVASSNAAFYAGAKPIFSDVDSNTINLSPEKLVKTFERNPKAKIVIPVHFSGLACDMFAIEEICKQNDAVIIEDAAQAFGASYTDGGKVGCCQNSLMTIFSLHPVKSITAGEGGVITTNDKHVYKRLLRLRSHGILKDDDEFKNSNHAQTDGLSNPWYYEMQELGFHYRITDIQCALGSSQLKKLNKFIQRRRYLVKRYDQAFSGLDWIKPAQNTSREHSAHHLYSVLIDFNILGISRAKVMNLLREKGIITQVHHIPVPIHPYYQQLGFSMRDCPNAAQYYKHALSIPLYYDLTQSQQDYVINTLTEILA
jgi:UDP-4-amino-4,6-dideoxy-N-acetyl-beta-L-altrosamine transaminase